MRDPADAPWTAADPAPALPDKPSLAVLPFRSLADDLDGRAFADGVSEHLTYTLACNPGLFVSGSPSAFTFRDARVDPRQASRALGVAHLLRGTVEVAAGGIVLTAELVSGADGAELWSERHEGRHSDAPALQGRIAERTVLTIAPGLAGLRPDAGRTRFPPGLGVYTRFLAAYTSFASTNADSIGPLMRTLRDVVRTLPDQPLPLAMLAQCQTFLVSQGGLWRFEL